MPRWDGRLPGIRYGMCETRQSNITDVRDVVGDVYIYNLEISVYEGG